MTQDPLQQLQASWQDLQARLAAGQINQQQFAQGASQLQAQDSQGRTWRIDPANGHWTWWDGQAWAAAAPPVAQTTHAQPAQTQASTAADVPSAGPQTLRQLGSMLLKGVISGIKRSLALRLMGTLVIGFGVWLFHTFLLIGPNGGFNSDNWWLSHILALGGWKFFGGSMVWGLAAWIITLLWSKRVSPGVMPFISGVFSMPVTVTSSMARVGGMSTALLLAGGTVGFLLGSLADSLFVGVLSAFLILLSVASGQASLVLLATRLGWGDLQRTSGGRHPHTQFTDAHGVVISGGLAAGFLATVVTSNWGLGLVVLVLLGLGVGTLVLYGGSKPRAAMILFLTASPFALAAQRLLADDGGWSEAGNSFGEWITSEGATLAAAVGAGPAVASMASFLVASGLSSAGLVSMLGITPSTGLSTGATTPTPNAPVPAAGPAPSIWNEQLGAGKEGDIQTAFVYGPDGKTLTRTGFIYDPASGGWRTVAAGAGDNRGNTYDPIEGWVSNREAIQIADKRTSARAAAEQDFRDVSTGNTAADRDMRDMQARHKQARELREQRLAVGNRPQDIASGDRRSYSERVFDHESALNALPGKTKLYKAWADKWNDRLQTAKTVKTVADVSFAVVSGGAGAALAGAAYTVGTETIGGAAQGFSKPGTFQEVVTGTVKESLKGLVKGTFKAGVERATELGLTGAGRYFESGFQSVGKKLADKFLPTFKLPSTPVTLMDSLGDGFNRYFGRVPASPKLGRPGPFDDFWSQNLPEAVKGARSSFGTAGDANGWGGAFLGGTNSLPWEGGGHEWITDPVFGKNV